MGKGSGKGLTRLCENQGCKREFTVNRVWQKFCSPRCRLVAWALGKAMPEKKT